MQQKRFIQIAKYLAYILILLFYFGSLPTEIHENSLKLNSSRFEGKKQADHIYLSSNDSIKKLLFREQMGHFSEWIFDLDE